MKVTKRKLSPTATAGVGAGITLVVALFGWFVLISPQRSHASSLDAEILVVEQQVSDARAAQMQSSSAQPIRSADLFRLTKAMPSDNDIAGVNLVKEFYPTMVRHLRLKKGPDTKAQVAPSK